jgi:CheY-like chemotaxis protein
MATQARTTPSVLLVNDMLREREIYASRLRATGYDIAHAETFTAAYEMAITRRCDIVVTDVRIGGSIRGLELIRRLKQDGRTADVPIIVLTSVSRPQDGEVALKAGANTVLQKPVSAPVLTEAIVRLRIVSRRHSPGALPVRRRERTARVCPQCVGILTYRRRWPTLAITRDVPSHQERRERLRYEAGWFCTNPGCDYLELARTPVTRE